MQERRKRQDADLIADLQPDQRFAPRAISARSVYGFHSGRNGKGNCGALNSETFASRAFNISRYVLSILQKARLWKNGVASGFAIDVARFPLPRPGPEIGDQKSDVSRIPSLHSPGRAKRLQLSPVCSRALRGSRRRSGRSRRNSGSGSDVSGG